MVYCTLYNFLFPVRFWAILVTVVRKILESFILFNNFATANLQNPQKKIYKNKKFTKRETDRHQTDRQTDRQRDRERQRERETERHRETERETERDRDSERDTERQTDRDRQRLTERDRGRGREREGEFWILEPLKRLFYHSENTSFSKNAANDHLTFTFHMEKFFGRFFGSG